ncbi:MAG: metalloregulator ArsR/SmtB family transcription factor [Paenibacillaceae bacterium]
MIVTAREFKDSIYDQFSKVGKALSSPKRLEILDLLSQGRKSVESIAQFTEMSLANVSQHLQNLLEAKLVKVQKKGTYAYYELADKSVAAFIISMRVLCQNQLAEVERIKDNFLKQHDNLEAISLEEVRKRMNEGSMLLIDVRPQDEYDAGHIPGAISIPIEQLEGQLSLLPIERNIIAYCRGPYCVYAIQAVELLQNHGFSADRIEAGIHEWNSFIEQTQH